MHHHHLLYPMIALLAAGSCTSPVPPPTVESTFVAVGTYTRKEGHVDGKGKGIYVYQFDDATGTLTYASLSEPTINPSYVAVSADGAHLYAANEHGGDDTFATGTVSAYRIDPATHALSLLNRQSAHGVAPCHVSLDPQGKYVFVANYVSGTVAMLPLAADGSLLPARQVVQHEGKGAHPRQDAAHAHYAQPSADGNALRVADLGTNEVYEYHIDRAADSLHLSQRLPMPPNAGPRHLAAHPNGNYLYVLNELAATIGVVRLTNKGWLLAQIISTLPEGEPTHAPAAAAIRIHPNGKFLYASNRATANSIASYAIDPASGELQLTGIVSTQGSTPRDIAIAPSGRWLLAANQDNGGITTFAIQAVNGTLLPTGIRTDVPTPVSLAFFNKKRK